MFECSLEVKNHAFFNGIDWEKVAERENDPPYAPTDLHVTQHTTLDLMAELNIDLDDEIDEYLIQRFSSMF